MIAVLNTRYTTLLPTPRTQRARSARESSDGGGAKTPPARDDEDRPGPPESASRFVVGASRPRLGGIATAPGPERTERGAARFRDDRACPPDAAGVERGAIEPSNAEGARARGAARGPGTRPSGDRDARARSAARSERGATPNDPEIAGPNAARPTTVSFEPLSKPAWTNLFAPRAAPTVSVTRGVFPSLPGRLRALPRRPLSSLATSVGRPAPSRLDPLGALRARPPPPLDARAPRRGRAVLSVTRAARLGESSRPRRWRRCARAPTMVSRLGRAFGAASRFLAARPSAAAVPRGAAARGLAPPTTRASPSPSPTARRGARRPASSTSAAAAARARPRRTIPRAPRPPSWTPPRTIPARSSRTFAPRGSPGGHLRARPARVRALHGAPVARAIPVVGAGGGRSPPRRDPARPSPTSSRFSATSYPTAPGTAPRTPSAP